MEQPTTKKPHTDETIILGADEVATTLSCSLRTANRLMRTGKIVARRVGRSWRTTWRAVLQYLEEK